MFCWSCADHVAEQLRELEQSVSLKQIRELFDNKEYSNVVQKLEPFLEYNISIPTDVSPHSTPCLKWGTG